MSAPPPEPTMPPRSGAPGRPPAAGAPWTRREGFPILFVLAWVAISAVVAGAGAAFALLTEDGDAGWLLTAFGVAFALLGPGLSRSLAAGIDLDAQQIRLHRGPSGLLMPSQDRAAPFSAVVGLEAEQLAPAVHVGRLDPDQLGSTVIGDAGNGPLARSWSRWFGATASWSPPTVERLGSRAPAWQIVVHLSDEPLAPRSFDGLEEIRSARTWPESPLALAGAATEAEARERLLELGALFGLPDGTLGLTRIGGTRHRVVAAAKDDPPTAPGDAQDVTPPAP